MPGVAGAHTVFEIHLHLVWVTKYRRSALTGEVALRVRDIIREICGQHEVTIMKGHVGRDQVHLFVSIPPQGTISRLLPWVKGKTAYKLLGSFRICAKPSGGGISGHGATFVVVPGT
jgi:putative transposase